jgi:hypothetical protein
VATMAETWTSGTLVGIDYYGRNLDIGNFDRKRLLNWANYGHFFFNKKELDGWYLRVERTMGL